MFSLRKTEATSIEKLKVALTLIKEEISIIEFSRKYKVSHQEAKNFKGWCRENYYYKSYKS